MQSGRWGKGAVSENESPEIRNSPKCCELVQFGDFPFHFRAFLFPFARQWHKSSLVFWHLFPFPIKEGKKCKKILFEVGEKNCTRAEMTEQLSVDADLSRVGRRRGRD